VRVHRGDDWVPPSYVPLKDPSGFETGQRVVHARWCRVGNVLSTRRLEGRAQDGSQWMVRVRWTDGGVAVDGDVQWVKQNKEDMT